MGIQFDLGAAAAGPLSRHKVGHGGSSLVGRCRQRARTEPL